MCARKSSARQGHELFVPEMASIRIAQVCMGRTSTRLNGESNVTIQTLKIGAGTLGINSADHPHGSLFLPCVGRNRFGNIQKSRIVQAAHPLQAESTKPT